MWLWILVTAVQTMWQEQLLDHFHLPSIEAGLFKQRYWVLSEPENPQCVFLLLCGQSDCLLNTPNYDYALSIARERSATVYLLEHRFYGASLPYSQASMLPQLFLRLHTDQVLADIAAFIQDKHLSVPWVAIGSGYAGALAAWARTRYPDLISAAWASSATVNLSLQYDQFDTLIYETLRGKGEECAQKVVEMTAFADQLYREERAIPDLTDLLNATAAFQATPDARPALWYLAGLLSQLVSLGEASELCSTLASSTSPAQSISLLWELSSSYGLAQANLYGVNPLNDIIWTSASIRQQYWQSCTQLGLFPAVSTAHVVSSALNVNFWGWYCNVIFGYPGGLPLPKVGQTRAAMNWKGSKIIYTNGVEDPWRAASEQSSDLSQQRISLLANCPGCAFSPDMQAETSSDPPQLTVLRRLIRAALGQWLG